MTNGSRKEDAISGPKFRPPHLAPQNSELVPEHHQLDVLDVGATAAADEQAEQSPNSEVEEANEHAADPRSPHPDKARPE